MLTSTLRLLETSADASVLGISPVADLLQNTTGDDGAADCIPLRRQRSTLVSLAGW